VAWAIAYERAIGLGFSNACATRKRASSVPNVTDKPGPAPRESSRRDWRSVARSWGPPGNDRLTTSVGLVLLIPLALETLTTLWLGSYLPVHIFLGLLLLPPVALKLASTGWRFLRYYTGNKLYRLEGPPKRLLRLLAPLLVASTLSLFGSGVGLILGRGGGLLLTVHTVSFFVRGVLMIVHVLAYLALTLRAGWADWRRHGEPVVAGTRSRRAALIGALLAGLVVALATYPTQQAWLTRNRENRDEEGRHVPARAARFGVAVRGADGDLLVALRPNIRGRHEFPSSVDARVQVRSQRHP
jgi:hypothetical protein